MTCETPERGLGTSDTLTVRPRPVRPGHRIGVAALSGVVEPGALDAGVQALEALGFRVALASNLRPGATRRGRNLFMGSDGERVDGFHELVEDDTISAIVFARGGHGVLRVLERIDWALLAEKRIACVGFSDLTPVLLGLVARAGLVAYHGPMAADVGRGLSAAEERSFLGALSGVPGPGWRLSPVAETLSAGRPERLPGPLLGGCLTMLAASIGTGVLPDLRGSILVLEDVNEPEYRIDRLLTQLRVSRRVVGVRAVVAGHFVDCDARASLRDFAQTLAVPLFEGLPAGHGTPNHTLPLGACAVLDTGAATLKLLG